MWDQTRVFVQVDLQGSSVGMVKDFYLFIYSCLNVSCISFLSTMLHVHVLLKKSFLIVF